MCDQPSTSREHVPPRALFPEKKHTPDGKDYRLSLIVVPSCDLHNSAKSADDEYMMQMLPMALGLNDVAEDHFNGKVQRSVLRNTKLLDALKASAIHVNVHDTVTDTWEQTMAMTIDLERIHGGLEMNARGIYFHHRGVKLDGPINVKTNFSVVMEIPEINDSIDAVFRMADEMLKDAPRHGSNPEVFYYRIDREGDIELMEFTFYGTSKALFSIFHQPSL